MTVIVPSTIRVLMPNEQVAEMKLETYLAGVVATEIGASVPLEALKAQAVASRTYAASAHRHLEQNADVCTTGHCQEWKRVDPIVAPEVFRAVSETWGIVATHDGKLIDAFFFEHCDGHTRSAEDLLMPPLPYLRGVDCACGFVALKGHGVGLCQRGAIVMARRGASFEQILRHYYRGVVVSQTAHAGVEEPRVAPSVETRAAVPAVPKARARRKKIPAPTPARPKPAKGARKKPKPAPALPPRPAISLAPQPAPAVVAETPARAAQERAPAVRAAPVVEPAAVAVPTAAAPFDAAAAESVEQLREAVARLVAQTETPAPAAQRPEARVEEPAQAKPPAPVPSALETPVQEIAPAETALETPVQEIAPAEAVLEAPAQEVAPAQPSPEAPTPAVAEAAPSTAEPSRETAALEVEGVVAAMPGVIAESALSALEAEWSPAVTRAQIDHLPGGRMIAGCLTRAGVAVTIEDAQGNQTVVFSGSAPHYGAGGFETLVAEDGRYFVFIDEQVLEVNVSGDTVFVHAA